VAVKAILVILQTILFLALFLAGSLMPAFHLMPMWSMRAGAAHIFVLDGLVLMIAATLLILLIQAATRRFRHSGGLTLLAFALALALGLAMKFGFVSA
jgi:hypothetical protein